MPLWLQRLKALDLLQAVREFPSFPILVETYRDVLQDAFDLSALTRVLRDIGTGAIAIRSVETEVPSPMAASLQFGFVMDWMYADDAPRAEQRAALLSLDRALLDELMGAEGADATTIAVLEQLLARRRGTAPKSRARTADELAALLDRASDLTLSELEQRVASIDEGRRGDPAVELLERGRAVAIDVPMSGGTVERRVILTEHYPRYLAAFGDRAMTTVYAGTAQAPRAAADVIPDGLRQPAMTRDAARRELLVRFVSLAGVLSLDDVLARYELDREWVLARLDDWTRAGTMIRGTFGGDRGMPRWAPRRLLEQARRRELAQARKAIEAVGLDRFSRFMLRWQHVQPSARLDADAGAGVLRQLYGIARPADQWEREYLPTRIHEYSSDALSRLLALGEMVWIGGTPSKADEPGNLSTIRFVPRGSARAWIDTSAQPPLSEHAQRVHAALERDGASFFDELLPSTTLTSRQLRDALRELVGAGLVTNDSMESLRAVIRWRPMISPRDRMQADPTRWLPADFTPSANRYIVQRRPNVRRLPKWKRPDGATTETVESWPGRWSLVRTARVLGAEADESAWAELVARQWLERYGIVSREVWRRERPAISWRAIYRELKRLEFRGDVRRGYFVRGLSGAQFALPEAVELLRSVRDDDTADLVVITVTDPANVYTLPLAESGERDAFVRPRTRGALLVLADGVVIMFAERRGERVRVRPGAELTVVTRGVGALVEHLLPRSSRDIVVATIDGAPASGSPWLDAFLAAGFRRGTAGLRYYRSLQG
jgi:ATP-dependent Lhr-like helicase